MIVALPNQKRGVGKTMLAPHLAGQWARPETRITLIDADPQGSVLGWSEQRAPRRFDRLFGVIGLARDTLHREAPELARNPDHIIIDGPPRGAALLRSALLAADLALIPAQLTPVDGLWSAEMPTLITEARVFRAAPDDRFALNRCPARTIIAREPAQDLAEHDPPALAARIGQHIFAEGRADRSARIGTRRRRSRRARDRGADPRIRQAVAMTTRSRNGGFGRGCVTPKAGSGVPIHPRRPASLQTSTAPGSLSTSLRGRIKIDALQRAVTAADMLRDLLTREFPDTDGDRL